jgi:hypothetical protein
MVQTVDDALLTIQHRAALVRTLCTKTNWSPQAAMLEMCNDIETPTDRVRLALDAVARRIDIPDE